MQPSATHVLEHAEYGYTTNLPLADITTDEAIVAYEYEGEDDRADPRRPGADRRAAPVLLEERQVGPRARAARRTTRPGFWEQNGYHMYGDPFVEQRHWGD